MIVSLSTLLLIFAIPIIAALWYRYQADTFRKAYTAELAKHIITLKKYEVDRDRYDEIFEKLMSGRPFESTLTLENGDQVTQSWKPARREEWPSEL